MNKTELVAAVAEKSGVSKKDTEAVIKSFVETVKDEVKAGEKVQLVGFGTFESTTRSARTGRNPQTGKEIEIAASVAPKFKPGKEFKDMLNK